MNKKFQNKQFAKMTNEELCAIVTRLKFQLVEARFKMSAGELEKVSVVKDIRTTIAKIFTELTNRGYKVSIGSHGVTMYDLNNKNKPISVDPDKLAALMKQNEKENKKADSTKKVEEQAPVKKEKINATIKEKKPVAESQVENKGGNK